MDSSASRWITLLVIALWLAVSALIDLTASVITANIVWGPGLPPADYIENLGSYQLGYFFFFSSITYGLAALLSGVGALVAWRLRHQSKRLLLHLVILNIILSPTAWGLAHLVSSKL
jgi:hypothetical protein